MKKQTVEMMARELERQGWKREVCICKGKKCRFSTCSLCGGRGIMWTHPKQVTRGEEDL